MIFRETPAKDVQRSCAICTVKFLIDSGPLFFDLNWELWITLFTLSYFGIFSYINIDITDHGFLRYSRERNLTFWCHINGLPQRLHPHLTLTQITYFTSSWMFPYKLAGNVVDLPLISDLPIPAFAASVDTMLRNSVASGLVQTTLGPSPPISKEHRPTK